MAESTVGHDGLATDHLLATQLWSDLGGPPGALDRLRVVGPGAVLPSVFDVTGFATATVAVAALAVAELGAVRSGAELPRVEVDRLAASASFAFERVLTPLGWELPPVWDVVAGDYETEDGWIKLHTNYRHHRDAVLRVLGVPAEREAVAAEVARWRGEELESAVIAADGCAAVMRTAGAWSAHPAGRATVEDRPVTFGPSIPIPGEVGSDLAQPQRSAPLAGLRVLDLTRVIAGPVATRYLAAYGADVLRIDPPGFEEVPALLPETTVGKRCAALDLQLPADRSVFDALVADAHVVVAGLRPGALGDLGYGPRQLRSINPRVITVSLDAYGWSGPWSGRRGFDSLVQMSTGIASAGAAEARTDRPTPLPVQALDHGLGHLLAAATCRAISRLVVDAVTADVRGSLVGASNVLKAMLSTTSRSRPSATVATASLETGDTDWGLVRRAPLAGRIHGTSPSWPVSAGPLGRHLAAFSVN